MKGTLFSIALCFQSHFVFNPKSTSRAFWGSCNLEAEMEHLAEASEDTLER
jgi:hypothetical protein